LSIFFVFVGLYIPLLLGVIFLLSRLTFSSTYNLATLRAPVISAIVAGLFAVFWATPIGELVPLYSGNTYVWSVAAFTLAVGVYWIVDSIHIRKLKKQKTISVKKGSDFHRAIRVLSGIVLALVLIPTSFITLTIVWNLTTAPISDHFNHDKFIKLDTSMQSLRDGLKAASDGSDQWSYSTECDDSSSGPFPSGVYNCTTNLSTEKQVSSVDEVNAMQAKYYPVVNNSSLLVPIDELQLESPDNFGKRFVVSAAERNYKEKESGVECNYSIQLFQKTTNSSFMEDYPGYEIRGGTGDLLISISCSDKARKAWY